MHRKLIARYIVAGLEGLIPIRAAVMDGPFDSL